MMSIRDKFFNAVRRLDDSYIPFEFGLCPSLKEEFKRRTGREDYEEYFDFPCRMVYAEETCDQSRYVPYYDSLENIKIGEWGVGRKSGSVAHFTEMQHPMKDFETIEEFEKYPYPDPDVDFDWASVNSKVASIKDRGLIAVAGMAMTIFEIAWYLRGMDNFMVDMAINPELANYHLDRITAIRCVMAEKFAAAGADVLHLGDDVSTQLSMLMNPDTWRELIKPRLAKVIQSAKAVKPDIIIFYHGDGNLQKIIPDLIEVGVEILNPIQPECMDPVEIKKKYGDRLSFCGTIGTQTTLPFGTAEDVRVICEKMIEEVGRGGGLILAPTHMVEPEVPWENIQAFIDAVNKYNNKSNDVR